VHGTQIGSCNHGTQLGFTGVTGSQFNTGSNQCMVGLPVGPILAPKVDSSPALGGSTACFCETLTLGLNGLFNATMGSQIMGINWNCLVHGCGFCLERKIIGTEQNWCKLHANIQQSNSTMDNGHRLSILYKWMNCISNVCEIIMFPKLSRILNIYMRMDIS
jgi:hypothetical protein